MAGWPVLTAASGLKGIRRLCALERAFPHSVASIAVGRDGHSCAGDPVHAAVVYPVVNADCRNVYEFAEVDDEEWIRVCWATVANVGFSLQ